MKISAPHIANLFEYASYQGIAEQTLRTHLIEEGLDVCSPQNTVSESEFLVVYQTLVNKTANPYFGLYYGCYLNIKALGFISELSLNASSIEQAVIFLEEYLKTSFPLISLSVAHTPDDFNLHLECTIQDYALKNHLLDTVYCFIYRELKLMLANDFLPRLQLPYSETSEYSKLLNAPIESGKNHLIQVDIQVIGSVINKNRVKEVELLLPQFMKMLDSKSYSGFSLQMRYMILNMCAPEVPTFGQVSKQFSLSDRTIQRKLTQEGQSFRKISDAIKKELSYFLVKGRQIKTQDIAYILGYSEPSAYLHAVKRWETSA